MNLNIGNFQFYRSALFLALLLALAWFLGQLAWQLISPPHFELKQPQIAVLEKIENVTAANNSLLYLFGQANTKPEPKPVEEKKVTKTRLDLKLLGVMLTPQVSLAIIASGNDSDSYIVGDKIQSGVSLEEVFEDYVVISNRGAREKLQMQAVEPLFSTSSQGSAAASLNADQKAVLQEVKSKALKNPISIVRYVRFQSINRKGKVESVKLWPRQQREIFTALGLKSGDKLLAVDGKSVDELSKSPKLWQELLGKSSLELSIDRNGSEISLPIEL